MSGETYERVNYAPANFDNSVAIWAVDTDNLGRTFVATEKGIFWQTNELWRRIETPSKTPVRSLSFGFDSKVYWGDKQDFGYLDVLPDGQIIARVLSDNFSSQNEISSNVWSTHAGSGAVYFQTSMSVYAWDGKNVKKWSTPNGIHTSFLIGERLYGRLKGVGLSILTNSGWRLVDGGSRFSENRVFFLSEIGIDTLMVGTRDEGMYLLSGGTATSLKTDYDKILQDHWLYGGKNLGNGVLALNTLGAGVLIASTSGKLLSWLKGTENLSDDNIVSMSWDGRVLSVGTRSSGLDLVLPPDYVSRYTESHGLNGNLSQVNTADHDLVVSSSGGVFVSTINDEKGISFLSFRRLSGIANAYSTIEYGSSLLVSTDGGIALYTESDDGSTVQYLTSIISYEMEIVTHEEHSYLLSVGRDGLSVYKIVDSGRSSDLRIEHVNTVFVGRELKAMKVDIAGGDVWVYEYRKGLLSVDVASVVLPEKDSDLSARLYPSSDSSDESHYAIIDGIPYYSENGRIYRYDRTLDQFYELFDIDAFTGVEDQIQSFSAGINGEIVVVSSQAVLGISIISSNGKSQAIVTKILDRTNRLPSSAVAVGPSGTIWYDEGGSLIRLEPDMTRRSHVDYSALITAVRHSTDNELLFGGTYISADGGFGSYQEDSFIPVVSYADKNLSIQFGSTIKMFPGRVQYQTKTLVDEEWSDWTRNDEAVFPNLEEGFHTIQVRARYIEGDESRTASFSFVILPPWYRTPWAYLSGLLLVSLFGVGAVRYVRMRRAHKQAEEQRKELERERVVVKKLQQANDSLTKANKLKDEFLATTSHELRTPLTAILGFTSVLKEEVPPDAEYREFLDIIEESGGRLMDTLNSLLDLAKLRAGIMEINREPADVYQYAMEVAPSLQEAAGRKGLQFKVDEPTEPLLAILDVYAYTRVLHNLIGNAVKFTDEGEVRVHFSQEDDLVRIDIMDTGVGIDEKFLPELFGEYMQESDGLSRSHEGSGLGLAISSQMISLMDGELSVESVKGAGSTFTFVLPAAEGVKRRHSRQQGFGQSSTA